MSFIYSKITSILNRIASALRNSFLFNIIHFILLFIEDQWVNSYFKKLYPSENFLGFLKRNRIVKNHLFSPLIVLLTFSAFLILSLNTVTDSLVFTIAIGFISFFIGCAVLPRFLLNRDFEKPLISFDDEDLYSIGFCIVILSIAFVFICVADVGGIPILKPSLRYSLRAAFTMPVFLIIPGITLLGSVYLNRFQKKRLTRSQARFRFLILIAIASVFLLALGYRTPLVAVLLIMIIMGYYGEILSLWEVVIGALIGVCAIIGIGYFRSVEEYTITTSTSPFYTLQSRADFTLHVLELLDFIGRDFGVTHGQMLLSSIPGSETGPRMMVGQLIAWRSEVTVTPTLLGQMVADFGRIGVAVQMLVLGFILGIGFKIMQKTKDYFYIGLYSLILTYAIVGVETGILDIQVLGYFAAAAFIYFIYICKSHSSKHA